MDFPSELVIKLAKEGADSIKNERERLDFLRNFCLVCKPWRDPGQDELWKKISIGFSDATRGVALDLLAASEGTRRGIKTRELALWSCSGKEVTATLGALHRIERLSLLDVNGLNVEVFGKESLLGELANPPAFCAPTR